MTMRGSAQSKMVVLVTDAWHPQVNGVVTVYDHIIPILEKRGYAVSVIHPGLFRTISIPFYREIQLAIFPRRQMRKQLLKMKPDAVHIAVAGPLGIAARAVCRAHGISFSTAYHTHFQKYGGMYLKFFLPLINAYLRWFHNNANALTTVSTESLKTELASYGFKNLVLWPFGVDTEMFKRNQAPRLPSLQKPVFTFFSRLAPEKSPEQFLNLPLLGTKLVIGDGPDRARLEKLYGSSATFVGYKKGQDLVDWLSMSDVLVFPSRTETFGLVVLEALACGIPVAAHDVMGPRDIITPGVDGYLSEDLADAAKKCLTLSRNDCRKKALEYSWERSARVFTECLGFYETT